MQTEKALDYGLNKMPSLPSAGAGDLFRWNSATPYLVGGIAFIMLVIAVALLVILCQDFHGPAGDSGPVTGEKSLRGVKVTGDAIPLPEFVVIMAGDDKPTYLAMPVAVSPSPGEVAARESVTGESSVV